MTFTFAVWRHIRKTSSYSIPVDIPSGKGSKLQSSNARLELCLSLLAFVLTNSFDSQTQLKSTTVVLRFESFNREASKIFITCFCKDHVKSIGWVRVWKDFAEQIPKLLWNLYVFWKLLECGCGCIFWRNDVAMKASVYFDWKDNVLGIWC